MKNIRPDLISLSVPSRLYQMPVPVIGLTGGIATGKSTVSKILLKQGFSIIDADQLVKSVYQKNEVISEIQAAHPECIVDQKIDFKILREAFFSNSQLQAKIESIIYQRMPQAFKEAYQKQDSKKQDFIIYDVPLLFEKKLAPFVDLKVCVWSSPEQQVKRLMDRDGISEELSLKILARQWDINKKRDQSDLVIMNDSKLEQLELNVQTFISDLLL